MTSEIFYILGFVILILIAYILYLKQKTELIVERKVSEREDEIRRDALDRSRATIKGHVAEQLAPYTEEFPFNASDARFLGSPVDYIIFDGYSEAKEGDGKEIKIVLSDVKKGPNSKLNRTQKKIKRAVEKGDVEWKTVRLED